MWDMEEVALGLKIRSLPSIPSPPSPNIFVFLQVCVVKASLTHYDILHVVCLTGLQTPQEKTRYAAVFFPVSLLSLLQEVGNFKIMRSILFDHWMPQIKI